MRKIVPSLAFLIASILLSSSCNQPFDPRGPVDQHLVVFTILSTERSVQFIRVTVPFLPADFNSASLSSIDNSVPDASVEIQMQAHYSSDGYRVYLVPGETIHLRDTVLTRFDSLPSALPLHAFVADPFRPQYGSKYDVYVGSHSHGQAWGSVTFPKKPTITMNFAGMLLLNSPKSSELGAPIVYLISLADSVKGYVSRLYLDYSVVKDGEWISERVELPLSSSDPIPFGLRFPIYPVITQAAATNKLRATYRNGYLQSVIKQLTDVKYAGTKIVFDRVVFMVLQVDPNLYSYCATSQLTKDPRSIRLDQPAVSRLNGGGYGLVGGYTLDSLVYLLPEYFYANNR